MGGCRHDCDTGTPTRVRTATQGLEPRVRRDSTRQRFLGRGGVGDRSEGGAAGLGSGRSLALSTPCGASSAIVLSLAQPWMCACNSCDVAGSIQLGPRTRSQWRQWLYQWNAGQWCAGAVLSSCSSRSVTAFGRRWHRRSSARSRRSAACWRCRLPSVRTAAAAAAVDKTANALMPSGGGDRAEGGGRERSTSHK